MPELPEAERGRRLLEKFVVGHKIVSVRVANDHIVYKDIKPSAFARQLQDRQACAAKRWGKYIWLEMDAGPCPVFHFGMSGSFHHYTATSARPDHWKVELTTEQGIFFALNMPRRFGRIRLMKDPRQEEPLSGLGFDPLLALPPLGQFAKKLEGRKGRIKLLLLDQSFAAGVGNWIADEILYQSLISPHRLAHSLTLEEVKRLRQAMRKIINHAVRVNADYRKFPKTWLFHHRWLDHRHRTEIGGQPKAEFRYDRIGGRTSAWNPALQK